MLASVMQDAIKAKAASRNKTQFKDPYIKPKVSKEDFLAEKSRGGSTPVSGAPTGSADLSPLIQSQQQMQRQLQQLVESMKNVGGSAGIHNGVGVASHVATKEDMAAQLDAFKREIRQSQRQASNDLLSQIQSIVEDAVKNDAATTEPSTSAASTRAEVSRLKREVAQLKSEVEELKQENEKLRIRPATTFAPAPKATPAWTSTSATPKSTCGSSAESSWKNKSPAASNSSNTRGEMDVKETFNRYELSLDIPGIKVADLKISYGGGALELEAKGEKYSFEVPQSKIDASNITATLQSSGSLQITVPKKR